MERLLKLPPKPRACLRDYMQRKGYTSPHDIARLEPDLSKFLDVTPPELFFMFLSDPPLMIVAGKGAELTEVGQAVVHLATDANEPRTLWDSLPQEVRDRVKRNHELYDPEYEHNLP
jgi:hypothetical protein